MKTFINKTTGTLMYIDDARVDEYIETGHEHVSNSDEVVSDVETNMATENTSGEEKTDKKSRKKGA